MIDERRLHTRVASKDSITVDILPNKHNPNPLVFQCNSRDFSQKGVRIHGHQAVELNQQVKIIVHMAQQKRDYNLFGKIMWVTETTESEHLAGIELIEQQDSDLLSWQTLFDK